MNNVRFYEVVDREPENPALSFNGGDYAFWRVVAVKGSVPVAVSYRTSSDFDYCPLCGHFDRHAASECGWVGADPAESDGWEAGALLSGEAHEREARFYAGEGWYNPIRRPSPERQEYDVSIVGGRMLAGNRDIGSASEEARNSLGYGHPQAVAEAVSSGLTVIYRDDGCLWTDTWS